MTPKNLIAYLAITIMVCAGPVRADDMEPVAEGVIENSEMAWDLLDGYLTDVITMRAQFRQILLDENQQFVQTAGGVLALKRPGQFRWDYNDPYEQLVLSDGAYEWLYDAEL
ncbi:MAG: outer membrane lipoprotein carrier protein LolA [Gammaproteobacteria bacterium]|nr:outer membrane lipoprotein carrier protein LolA [Gammaproteobacteria bacterium]